MPAAEGGLVDPAETRAASAGPARLSRVVSFPSPLRLSLNAPPEASSFSFSLVALLRLACLTRLRSELQTRLRDTEDWKGSLDIQLHALCIEPTRRGGSRKRRPASVEAALWRWAR